MVMGTTNCVKCGAKFSYEPIMIGGREFMAGSQNKCPSCQREADAKEKELERKQRDGELKEQWKLICPPLYQRTVQSRLPKVATDKVLSWKFGPKGLVLYGGTGKGKTRAAFLLLERLHMSGVKVVVFHGNSFAHQCALRFGDFSGEEWIEALSKIDLVFIDDLGKFKLTERVEAELFGLIETRMAWDRPMIFTVNHDGDSLADKMTTDRGEPMVRRLREFCESIKF